MGADGGVVYMSLKKPTPEAYKRVTELLKPFWQFLSEDKGADSNDDTRYEWEQANVDIGSPGYLVGYYGTDCGDWLDLGDLRDICSYEQDELYELTFDELDLECRTTPNLRRTYEMHDLHKLWYEHFGYTKREEVLKNLGPLTGVVVKDWVHELNELLRVGTVQYEETWT